MKNNGSTPGPRNPSAKRVAVLGGGISGLATAYFLKKKDPSLEIRIFEKEARPGGLVDTLIHNNQYFEMGARGLRTQKLDGISIGFLKDLGLWNQLVMGNPKASKKYIYLHGKLQKIPSNPFSAMVSPVTQGGISAIWKDIRVRPSPLLPKESKEDETIESFAYRHFGKKISHNIFDTVFSGVWAGDISKLSVNAALPHLTALEGKYGSLIKGVILSRRAQRKRTAVQIPEDEKEIRRSGLISFKGGMNKLVNQVASHLEAELLLGTHVNKITRNTRKGEEGYEVHFKTNYKTSEQDNEGENPIFQCDLVISTLPSYVLQAILDGEAPRGTGKSLKTSDRLLNPVLKNALSKVKYAPLAIVPLYYDRKVNTHKGFGYLVEQNGSNSILGVEWNDQTFPELNKTQGSSFTVLVGGTRFKNFEKFSKSDFVEIAHSNLQSHLKFEEKPSFSECKILPKALPQYNLGHMENLKAIHSHSPKNFYVRGNFVGGVGISSIIRNAYQSSEDIL